MDRKDASVVLSPESTVWWKVKIADCSRRVELRIWKGRMKVALH